MGKVKKFLSFICTICISASALFSFSGCNFVKRQYSGELIEAIKANDMARLQALVDIGLDLDKSPSFILSDNPEYPPLCLAARYGNYDAVKILVDAGADVNVVYCPYAYNYTPLSLTFEAGGYEYERIEIAKYLIENGADISHQTRFGDTVLSRFVLIAYDDEHEESFGFFQYLLEKGATVEEGPHGHIVFGACRDKSVNFLEYLLEEYELDVNIISQTSDRSTLLMQTTLYASAPNACEFLLNHGADKTLKDSDGRTAYDMAVDAYEFAVESGNTERIESFQRIIELLED